MSGFSKNSLSAVRFSLCVRLPVFNNMARITLRRFIVLIRGYFWINGAAVHEIFVIKS